MNNCPVLQLDRCKGDLNGSSDLTPDQGAFLINPPVLAARKYNPNRTTISNIPRYSRSELDQSTLSIPLLVRHI